MDARGSGVVATGHSARTLYLSQITTNTTTTTTTLSPPLPPPHRIITENLVCKKKEKNKKAGGGAKKKEQKENKMDPVRRAHIRRDLRNALTDEALYANEQWWREFARNPAGCPLERFRVFGGVLANATPEEVKDAFPEGSSDVVAVDAATGLIRPVRTPSEDNHIFRRTVFVQPIPFYAVDNDITTFFSKWGKIEKLQRREWMDYKDPRNPVLRKKPSVFVVYRTREEADKCVASTPTFAAATGLGRHFIPALHVEIRKSVDPDENAAIPKAPAAIETPAASAAVDTLHLRFVFVFCWVFFCLVVTALIDFPPFLF